MTVFKRVINHLQCIQTSIRLVKEIVLLILKQLC